ncbi:hypothetical protein AZH53_09820 [Methanomicrobiaceae archaeon CYW5]|uniref:hypothetical protein n=1 Tax=Methanovulcanius yangii TaxID=1789227 RepID=UPI0029CA21F5|nr:hypothetical protein [Methanovulcanius yangii]MBT8508701.1 hypothetical protein [Methanovulcanius yangii]
MADFVQTTYTKSAVRELSAPIADIGTFDGIVSAVIAENPFGCTAYTYQGATVDGVTRSQERYDAKIVYEDTELEQVGDISAQVETVAAFSAAATELMGNAALAAIIGGTAVRDTAKDTFYCKLKCHDPSGEVYYVTFSRDKVRVSSYESDAIVGAVETWADTVPELA